MAIQGQKIIGVVLAGGLARRMGGTDKGLVQFGGKPLLSYAIAAIQPLVDEVVINANRNQHTYKQFGFPVLADRNQSFDGPLAGISSILNSTDADFLLTMPCDCPLIDASVLGRMVSELEKDSAECLVADDGQRLHPVFLLIDSRLKQSLNDYLAQGERKIDRWVMQHRWGKVDFSDCPGVFRNINSPQDLAALEQDLSVPEKQ